MKKLVKLNFNDFKDYSLLTSNLKCIVGGGTQTSFHDSTSNNPKNGTDFINDCGGVTTYADGSRVKGDTIES